MANLIFCCQLLGPGILCQSNSRVKTAIIFYDLLMPFMSLCSFEKIKVRGLRDLSQRTLYQMVLMQELKRFKKSFKKPFWNKITKRKSMESPLKMGDNFIGPWMALNFHLTVGGLRQIGCLKFSTFLFGRGKGQRTKFVKVCLLIPSQI